MTAVVYAPGAQRDLERVVDFLATQDSAAALAAATVITEAIELLERHPLIGRPVESGLRELVISRGQTGYVALYDYLEAVDTLVVLAIRHQREADYEIDDGPLTKAQQRAIEKLEPQGRLKITGRLLKESLEIGDREVAAGKVKPLAQVVARLRTKKPRA